MFVAYRLVSQSKGIFSFLGGGPSYDEAADLYKNAANQFKLLKNWNRAGETLVGSSTLPVAGHSWSRSGQGR